MLTPAFPTPRSSELRLPLALEEVEVPDEGIHEAGAAVFAVAQRADQKEDRQAALAGDAGAGGDVLAGLLLDVELDPLAAVGVDGALHQLVLGAVRQAVADRKRVVWGKSVIGRVDIGGHRIYKKKQQKKHY